MHHQVDQVSVPKRIYILLPNAMDFHRIQYQWRQQLHLLDPYQLVGGGENNLPLPDMISGNNTLHSNM